MCTNRRISCSSPVLIHLCFCTHHCSLSCCCDITCKAKRSVEVCSLMSFRFAACRNSWWCLTWNSSRCLIQLAVLYDSALLPLLPRLETLGVHTLQVAFCCFESKISPHSGHRPVSQLTKLPQCYRLTHSDCLHLRCGMTVVQRKPRNGIWNMNRHHLSNIRWVKDISVAPDTGIGSDQHHV